MSLLTYLLMAIVVLCKSLRSWLRRKL